MAKMWQPQSSEVLQSWIDALVNEASDELTDWENSFLDSIRGHLNLRGTLTQRQEEILERIYTEKTK